MKNLANFLLFQAAWFVAVAGAARGWMWAGPTAVIVIVVVHLALVTERARELRYVLFVGLLGAGLDSLLAALGATVYPSSTVAWSFAVVPPWIVSLWVAFATLPRLSLAWLASRPRWWAVLFGAIGGPLSYLAGTRMGAVAVGEAPLLTWSALAIEYAVVTPLLLHFAPRGSGIDVGSPSTVVEQGAPS